MNLLEDRMNGKYYLRLKSLYNRTKIQLFQASIHHY